jgi:TonB-linked SusC/RagA family outer membrane protein
MDLYSNNEQIISKYLLKKVFNIMRSTIILCLLATFCSFAEVGYSQKTELSLHLQGVTLQEAFNAIKAQSDFSFWYRNDEVNLSRKVSVNADKQNIYNVLNQLLRGQELSFTIDEKHIIIYKNGMPYDKLQNKKKVTGKVIDEKGSPIIGANIVEKGTTNGIITDIDGKYILSNISPNAILVISYIGMQAKEVPVKGNSVINVVLKEDAVALSDVVIIGYGVTKKSDLTGSVSSVSLDDVSRQPVLRVEEALRGKAPGVQISQENGAPGASMKIRIRGANSVNGNNDPLYVIDGFIGADFTMINPNDIESISILKDASATSMYGSRGSNGVVLITTKLAKIGDTRVEYNGFVSIDHSAKKLDVLSAKEYMLVANERQSALGANPYFSDAEIESVGNGVNWQDEILRTTASQNHQLAISGGQQNIKYYLSTSYQDQEGVVKNSFFKKYGLNTNINSTVAKKFEIAFNLNGNYYESRNNATYDGRNSPMGEALIFPPNIAIKDDNGQYNISPGGYGPVTANPVFSLNNGDDNGYGIKMLANLKLTWTIIDGLKLSVSGGTDIGSTKSTSLSTNDKMSSVSTCIAQAYDNMNVSYQNTNQLSFTKTFNSIHNVDAALVYEQQKYIARSLGGYSTGFPTIALGVNALGLGSSQTASSGYTEWSLQSYLGRINYGLMNRYLFTASMRIDGSSKFATGNKYGYFPSIAFAWRLSEENFIKNSIFFQI